MLWSGARSSGRRAAFPSFFELPFAIEALQIERGKETGRGPMFFGGNEANGGETAAHEQAGGRAAAKNLGRPVQDGAESESRKRGTVAPPWHALSVTEIFRTLIFDAWAFDGRRR